MINRVFASLTVLLALGCAPPPSPPTPPHVVAPSEMPPLLTRSEAGIELVAATTTLDAAAIPLAPPSGLPTEPAPAAVDAGAAADATKTAAASTLVGDYRYDSGRSSVRKSIDAVVGEMSVFARGIARKRLLAANEVPKRIAIRQEGNEVTVLLDGRAYTATLGGGSRRVKDGNGEVSRMRLAMRGEALYQTLHTDQGDRTNVYTPRDDGGLTMSVRIKSPQLPDDVHYRLVFDPK